MFSLLNTDQTKEEFTSKIFDLEVTDLDITHVLNRSIYYIILNGKEETLIIANRDDSIKFSSDLPTITGPKTKFRYALYLDDRMIIGDMLSGRSSYNPPPSKGGNVKYIHSGLNILENNIDRYIVMKNLQRLDIGSYLWLPSFNDIDLSSINLISYNYDSTTFQIQCNDSAVTKSVSWIEL